MLAVDIQGTQSIDHRDRGVASYIHQVTRAIEQLAPGAVDIYSLNPDLPLPGHLEPLVASGKLRFSDEIDWSSVDTLHVMSPYELAAPLDRVLPPGWQGRLVVTLFDLISEVLADVYLEDPGLRRRYRARHELVRQADLVLAISKSSAQDGMRLLGLDNEQPGRRRVLVTPLAPAPRFVPSSDQKREPFVLYTGGTDHRKNVEGLIEAWGLLPEHVRSRYTLVLACNVKPLERNHYEVMAGRLGFAESLTVTGWLPDDEIVRLTQRASLAVWPSLYEGFGLPVVEALACGTPVVGANTSSTPELLPADALFDPHDPADMARAIERALTDRAHRESLVRHAATWPRRTYDDVARETLAAYESLTTDVARPAASRRRTGSKKKRRVAFVSPLPPVPGGVSDYSFRLLDELVAAQGDELVIDAFVDGPPHERGARRGAKAPEGVTARALGALGRVEAIDGRYDHVVISLGNSEYHTGALELLLRERRGVVIAHDVRLTNLYRFAQWQNPSATPGGFQAVLSAMYPGLPPALGARGEIPNEDAERWGVLMAKDAIAASDRYLVTSPFALDLARLDARAADRDKLAVLPFSVGAVPLRDPTPADERTAPPLVASFGVVNDVKQGAALVDAFRLVRQQVPDAQLVFVGPVGDAEANNLRTSGVELTGELPAESYLAWLDRAWVAVQLRSATNGESSGAVGDCLTAGVPTIVTAIGPARDIPDGTVVHVAQDAPAVDLAGAITRVLSSPTRRRALGNAAQAYAREHSFARAAQALYDLALRS